MIIMNKHKILFSIISLASWTLFCQVGIGTLKISEKAILHIESVKEGTYKGLMPPRVPDDIAKASISPFEADEGLIIYVMESQSLEIWSGNSWQRIHVNSAGGYAKDLFISEYVEGSSNNKAIEIANFTGRSVNLENYALLDNSNGAGSNTSNSAGRLGGMGGGIVRLASFVLNHGEVYVIAGITSLPNRTDLSHLADQSSINLTFNGDDSIVLMKNNGHSIVDVMGIPFSQWEYGKDITLRRKPGFGPSKIYTPGQFEVYPMDTFEGLGSHEF